MNMKQVEGFCLLAQTLNFSRAAEQMYISQPAFSRMIVSLEKELGCQLFFRSKTEPKLTIAGEQIYHSMLEMQRHYQDVKGIAVLASERKLGIIRVGTPDDGLDPLSRGIFRRFRKEYPNVAVAFRTYSEAEIFHALEMEQIDIALTAHYPPVWQENTQGLVIRKCKMCAVLNREHPLAQREEISVRELAGEPFVMMSEKTSQMGYAKIMSLCFSNGFTPKITMEADSMSNALAAVDCGLGCIILTDRFVGAAGSNVAFVPLSDGEDGCDWMIWKKDTKNSQVDNVRKCAVSGSE